MNSSNAANKPSDIEAQFTGEARGGDGYQYWTTSQLDEESLDIREQVASGALDEKVVKKPRRKLLAPGAFRRTGIRLASLILITILAGLAYFVFNYVQVSGVAGDDQTQSADAAIVMGAAQYNGSPSNVLLERLDHAFYLYDTDVVDRIFVTGAGAEGDITTEGLVGLEHLIGKGVPEEDIILIPEGTNSWQQLSASAAAIEVLEAEAESAPEPEPVDELTVEGVVAEQSPQFTVLLVSDEYHNYRLLDIADELGIEAYVSPSAVEGTTMNVLRESAAVSIGRITGYRRLSAFTE